jgi:hypothetical protein
LRRWLAIVLETYSVIEPGLFFVAFLHRPSTVMRWGFALRSISTILSTSSGCSAMSSSSSAGFVAGQKKQALLQRMGGPAAGNILAHNPACYRRYMSDAGEEKKGKPFERLVAGVQKKLDPGSKVDWDVELPTPAAIDRQIDVLVTVTGTIDSTEMRVVIEAKDWIEPVGIEVVDAFNTVIQCVGGHKGILVTSGKYTKPALAQARALGIDTCVLRPAKDEDWEGYLRQFHLIIHAKTTVYDDAEIELDDGEIVRVPPTGIAIVSNSAGETEFFDRLINKWLHDHPKEEGRRLELRLAPHTLFRHRGDTRVPIAVLRCSPRLAHALTIDSITQRPEDWVFMKQLPDGMVDEKSFFVFKELEMLAEQFKKGKG